MIESLHGLQFQNHAAIDIELAPGVTTLVGPSAAGKSAVLRLLKWVLTNAPRGTAFVGAWGKAKAAVGRLRIDRHTVVRKRSRSHNLYKLDGKVLKAFGATPPRAVQDLANVGPLNFQGQLEPPLWFTLSPSEVSRRLNAVVRLDAIDRALKSAATILREANACVTVCRDRLRAARAEKKALAWAPLAVVKIGKLEKLDATIAQSHQNASKIDAACDSIAGAIERRRMLSRAIVGVNQAVSHARRARELRQQAGQAANLSKQLYRCERLLRYPLPDLGRLRRLLDRAAERRLDLRRLESVLHGLELATMGVESCDEKIKELAREVKSRLGTTCPTCGNPISWPSSAGTAISGTTFPSPVASHGRVGMTRKPTPANS